MAARPSDRGDRHHHDSPGLSPGMAYASDHTFLPRRLRGPCALRCGGSGQGWGWQPLVQAAPGRNGCGLPRSPCPLIKPFCVLHSLVLLQDICCCFGNSVVVFSCWGRITHLMAACLRYSLRGLQSAFASGVPQIRGPSGSNLLLPWPAM